ncbi:MAG: threonine synthase, partial [Burkholderiaceae bacterium]
MRYQSTRGHPATPGFSDILLGGLAPDGGLYLPERYPQVSDQELNAWRTLPYAALAAQVMKKFATDIPTEDIEALTAKTYTARVYCNGRS